MVVNKLSKKEYIGLIATFFLTYFLLGVTIWYAEWIWFFFAIPIVLILHYSLLKISVVRYDNHRLQRIFCRLGGHELKEDIPDVWSNCVYCGKKLKGSSDYSCG